jgi:multisubunit Na+/H+ antiporter MnhC subunit
MKCNLIYALLLLLIGSGFVLITHTDLHSLALSLLSFAVLAFPLLTLITQRGRKETTDSDIYLGM